MEDVSIIGIDLAKRNFQLHGARADGTVAFRRKLTREKLLGALAEQPRCIVAMEACASSHHWGAGDCPLGSCGPAHPAHLREAIREATEK